MKLLLALAWLLSACASRDIHAGRSQDYAPPTLLVINEGMVPVRVWDDVGRLMANVYPGEKKCLMFSRENMNYLVFRKLGGVPQRGPEFSPFGTAGWVVRIGNTPLWMDVLSLQPGEPCR